VVQQFRQPFDDGKPQPQALAAVTLGVGDLVELLEHPLLFLFGDARTAVPDLDAHQLAAPAGTDHHPALVGVVDGIGGEVAHDAFQKQGVAADHETALRHLQPDALVHGLAGEIPAHVVQQILQTEAHHARLHRARIQLGDVQ
jgi:hypothetical protein